MQHTNLTYLPSQVDVLYFSHFFFVSKKRGKFVTATYQRRLVEMAYVPATFYIRTALGAVRCASKVFLTFLFSNKKVGIQF